MENENKFLIIDGNSIMNRAFYGIRLLSTKDGTYTNAVYGFLNIYYMMMEKLNPNYVAVTFDLSAPTFRHKIFSEYKAGRKSMPDELRPQMSLIKEVLNAMNIPILEIEGYEADDLLGTVANKNSSKGIHTFILTGDRDSLQLVCENTSIVMPSTKMGKTEYTIYTPEKVQEVYNITPKQVIDLKALMGDKSDNIPGIPKVGEKTATSLLEQYNNVENIYENISTIDVSESLRERLIENKELAKLSYDLATINVNVPIDLNYDELKLKEVDLPTLSKLFIRLSFKKFLEKYNVDEKNINNLETTSSKEFYADLENTKFIVISNIDEVNINEKDNIVFTYFNSSSSYNKLIDYLIFMIKNNIYLLKLDKNNIKYALEKFCTSKATKIGYDIKEIIRIAFQNGIDNIQGFADDIKIAYYLINSTETNYSIENIVFNMLDVNFPEIENIKKNVQIQTSLFDVLEEPKIDILELEEIDKKYIYTYLSGILKSTPKLLSKLEELELNSLYREIEMPLIETLANIESNGMYLDTDKLKEFCIYLDENISSLTSKIYKLAKEEFNINSPAQLGGVLFDKLNLPVSKKTKSGYSTDKEALEAIEDSHEIIPAILEYRTLAKLKSTYIDGLLSAVESDGRIHTTFMQAVTATGRLSSVEPNLQNIPVRTELGSKIRECFVASSNEYKIVDADYSQIELRVLADMANDTNMIDAYNKDEDIHKITASQVFNAPLSEVTKELRSKAKAVNFGIVYGISDYGLAKNIHSTRAEAKEYIENYLNHYTGIANYMKEVVTIGEQKGYVVTKFGRRRTVPELKSANYNTRNFGERVAMNMPIQGTAADIMKIAMNNLYKKFKENNLKSKIVMQVHDELIVEAVLDEVEKVQEYMRDSMENAAKLKVPLAVDINIGTSWLEAK